MVSGSFNDKRDSNQTTIVNSGNSGLKLVLTISISVVLTATAAFYLIKGAPFLSKNSKKDALLEYIIAGDIVEVSAKGGVPFRPLPSQNEQAIKLLEEGTSLRYMGITQKKEKAVQVNGEWVNGVWVNVKTMGGIEGWVFSGSVKRSKKKMLNLFNVEEFDHFLSAKCTGYGVRHWLYPSIEEKNNIAMGMVNRNDNVVVTGRSVSKQKIQIKERIVEDYYYQIEIGEKKTWISGHCLEFKEESAEDVVVAIPSTPSILPSEEKALRVEVNSSCTKVNIQVPAIVPCTEGGQATYNVKINPEGRVEKVRLLKHATTIKNTDFTDYVAELLLEDSNIVINTNFETTTSCNIVILIHSSQ